MNNQCLSPTIEYAKNMQSYEQKRSRMMLYSEEWVVGGVSQVAAAGLRGLQKL